MKKYSVLTILMGNYDKLHELPFTNDNNDVEFICVTDNKHLKSNTWNVIYDESLDKPTYNGFDRTFLVRYNPFKYCNSNICIRIDASINPLCDFKDLINKFESEQYDVAFNIHPSRTDILTELEAWKQIRKIDQINLQKNYICDIIQYDLSTQGIIQNDIAVIRNNDDTKKFNSEMISLLYDCTDNPGHVNRLDQTLMTAYFYKNYSHLKVMPLSSNMFLNNRYRIFLHGTNTKVFTYHALPFHILNNQKVNAYE